MFELYQGDCLEIMKQISDKSIDMILCDLPYGTTGCAWDIVIPFDKLWKQYNRVIKDNGVTILFGQEPFSSYVRMSNIANYRYDYVWKKTKASNFAQCRKVPMRFHENIMVFYKKYPKYNLWDLKPLDTPVKSSRANKGSNIKHCVDKGNYYQTETGFHNSVLEFSNKSGRGHLHPTQKPTDLLCYLIKTYTNEGDIVLDSCMGSGSTGVAAKALGRNFIGIELDENYFRIAKERIESDEVLSEVTTTDVVDMKTNKLF